MYDVETGEIFISWDVILLIPFFIPTPQKRNPCNFVMVFWAMGAKYLMKDGLVNGPVILMGPVNNHKALQHLVMDRQVKVGIC